MRIVRVLSVFLLFTAICNASDNPPSARSWEMLDSTGSVNNYFGWSVAISGNTVVVGSLAGQVYVYEKPTSGWGNMVQTAELTPSEEGTFGPAVAISGNTIVVGSDNGGGEAYVFVKPSGGWTNMTQTAILSDGLTGDYFGGAVAIEGDTIVVGAASTINGNRYQGSAYVFVKPASGWATTSAFNAQLTASDGSYEDFFGTSVAMSGDTVAVGQPDHNDQTGPGAVYVFVEPTTGWATMTQTAELTESVQGPNDEFGLSVAISGDTIAAGAPQAEAAYVFVEPATGWANMTETAKLQTTYETQNFGFSIGTDARQVIVGDFSGDTSSAFVYAEPAAGWGSTSTPSLLLTNGQTTSFFGYSVAVGAGAAFVGAPYQTVEGHGDQGAVYGFELSPP
jgi:hypothetical protein